MPHLTAESLTRSSPPPPQHATQVRDAQQDGEPEVRPAAGVVLPGLRHVPEAPEPAGGGHGEAHQSHRPPQAGEEG